MKLLIIGGVAGGMSAAARARRNDEKSSITVLEKGEFISFANCGLPYYIGGAIEQRAALFVQTPEAFRARFNVDVRVNSEALSIDPKAKKVSVKDLTSGKIYEETYDKLLLSPGAVPVKPPIPGIESEKIFTLRNIPDTDSIKEFIKKNKPSSAIVVGGGYIGIEMAENLAMAGLKVTVVEALPQVMAVMDAEMAALAERELVRNGVTVVKGSGVKSFSETANGISTELADGQKMETDMVLFSIGVAPDVKLAKEAGLAFGRGITVNAYLQTSDPDIYAVGDAIEFASPITGKPVVIPLAGPANKQGRMAADNIVSGNSKKYPGTLGTAVLKIFEMTAAVTGIGERALKAAGIECDSVIVHPGSHAGYYPGASTISLKLIFSPKDGRILGAQACGYEGVEKRIDVISAYMSKKGTVHDLAEFEQAYAPPFSSAKDPVNMAGFTAQEVLEGKAKTVKWDEINDRDFFVLDVRTKGEAARGAIPGSVNIPVDTVRQNMDKIPKDKKIATYCAVGVRSHVAARILAQNGYDVYGLSGGYVTYSTAKTK